MKLFTELHEDVQIITEANAEGKKEYFIEGIFLQDSIKNKNGRMYPKHVMRKEVGRYIKEVVDKKVGWGELNHPKGPGINLERVTHRIVSLKEDGTNWIGKAKLVTKNPCGMIVHNLIEEGGGIVGVSSRAMGSLKESNGINIVQDDFYLSTAADIVADPSAPDAYVRGLMEGKEWVWENGILQEHVIAEHKKIITKASSIMLETRMVEVFTDFLKKVRENS